MSLTTLEIGQKLLKHCQKGTESEALDNIYHAEAVSIEADGTEVKGVGGIKGKHEWWAQNFEVHDAKAEGPFPNGDKFAIIFEMDVTNKENNQRSQMKEVGMYTVQDQKITREEFYYQS